MTAATEPLAPAQRLLLRGQAIGLCGRLLSEGGPLEAAAAELRQVLKRLDIASPDLEAGSIGGILAKGTVPAYETSYEPGTGSAGGPTFQMADIAGFYQAFGFEVTGERPDHIVPELEFLALLLVKEAYALIAADRDGAAICAEARGKFVADHLGRWLPLLAQRARETEGGEPLAALAGTIADLAEISG